MATLKQAKFRNENREMRNNEYHNMNSNDMMSVKSMTIFITSLFKKNNNEYDDDRLDDEKKLIKTIKEKLKTSKEEAIKFLDTKEFKNLNTKTYYFSENEVEIIKRGIEQQKLTASDFLQSKDNIEKQTNKNLNKNTQRAR